jgi:hypothetical protein
MTELALFNAIYGPVGDEGPIHIFPTKGLNYLFLPPTFNRK